MADSNVTPESGQEENSAEESFTADKRKKEKEARDLLIPEELRPILQDLPDPQKRAVEAILFGLGISIKRESFRSPLPPPSHLKGYNDVIPNGAERILTMAEKQSEHRISMETTVIGKEQNQSGRGQNYGFIIALAFLIASFILIYTDHDVAGTIIGSIDLVALVTVFVLGKRSQKEDLSGK